MIQYAMSRICSNDEENHGDDIDIREMVNILVALVQNDIKNVNGQKLGHEKRLHKRPLDDESRYLVIGLQVSDDEEDHRNDFKGQAMVVKNSDSQKVGP
ncbi:hypothetical protein CTI12_AA369060 [Artemisia annua]|uniref:Uncharacterized protein n=1 Tax=Artemisia annua TaxID=35608 RepID=A0A2U1MJX2_ARTAN|nr:hypothetical protein CTI12_AA369060 [Artemisia annua]